MLYLLEDPADLPEIKRILKIAYEKFKLFQSCLLNGRRVFNESRGLNETLWTICTYNPFREQGVLFCRDLQFGSIGKSVEIINDFMKDRIHNLNGYPLKVILDFLIGCLKFGQQILLVGHDFFGSNLITFLGGKNYFKFVH